MSAEDRSQRATSEGRLPPPPSGAFHSGAADSKNELADQWRAFGRAATLVALLTAPAVFLLYYLQLDIGFGWSLLATALTVAAMRGFVDIVTRRYIPWPSLFGDEGQQLKEADIVGRRRIHAWRRLLFWTFLIGGTVTVAWLIFRATADPGESVAWLDPLLELPGLMASVGIWALIVPMMFLTNFLILFGPMVYMGISQIKAYEPGDADWGVKLDDVRGQAEAKEDVRRIVTLWQSGDVFEQAGGKRERGLMMLGAPGTGKTMMSKALATNFNAPFISIPGSGFAQMFIGLDVVIVRYLAWRAKRLARKWGGQCIVFIDEIDAVGMRRQALGGHSGLQGPANPSYEELFFYGSMGAVNASEDLILETRQWREQLFASRHSPATGTSSALGRRYAGIVDMVMPGMGGGGSLALNQLLVVMDGIGDPPFWRRFWTVRLNTILDMLYVVPTRIRGRSLRLPRPKPRSEQIFFVGATNVPIDVLDPALMRPGRMGRHIWFRTPTKQDRLDVFNLYLGKVSHEGELDLPSRREELARVTNGYSPAMIEQTCSMALTVAHYNGRVAFGWEDIVDAMTTIESGTAVGVEYVPEETRAVAIHEAGHAVAAHVYMTEAESTRLSIRMRGRSLGHHQALEKEERFSRWQHEEMARLIWTLGAMAAERVFYDENSSGVGGDVQSATARAALMVGAEAMGPDRIDLAGWQKERRAGFVKDEGTRTFRSRDEEEAVRSRIMERFEEIGVHIMNRAGSPFDADPIGSVLSDPDKRSLAAQILGQAYLKAYHLMDANRDGLSGIADVLVERRELHGDEVLGVLDAAKLTIPEIDYTRDEAWPRL
jgi:ATP-dependent Zn protease